MIPRDGGASKPNQTHTLFSFLLVLMRANLELCHLINLEKRSVSRIYLGNLLKKKILRIRERFFNFFSRSRASLLEDFEVAQIRFQGLPCEVKFIKFY